ncbi:MAG: hypothetical protein ABJB97_09130 [Acidobacteriota bacterium]
MLTASTSVFAQKAKQLGAPAQARAKFDPRADERLNIGEDTAPAPLATTAGQLIISEFRLRGPGGATDEFVELYNTTGATLVTQASDASAGLGVAASDNVLRCTVPNGTSIPAGGHYLCTNSLGYSLSTYPAGNGTTATANATYTTDIPDNAGIGVFSSTTTFAAATKLDAVGSASEGNADFKEGTGYPTLSAFNVEQTLYRDLKSGTPRDTGNNATDFLHVDTFATDAGMGSRLGAPGPENLTSPIQRNATVKASLVDSGAASTAAPNRVRDSTPNSCTGGANCALGTLTIRRKFTNTTGAAVTRLRFRIVDITTFSAPAGTADLRALTSTDVTVTLTGGGTTLVRGLTLEQPPNQPNGGGFNSSQAAGIVTAGTPIANGASINVQFVLGVQQSGSYRFFVNVEALP